MSAPKKCKACGVRFIPEVSGQSWCSFACSQRVRELARLKRATARANARAKTDPALFGCNVCDAPCVHLEPEPRCSRHAWGRARQVAS